MRLKALLVAALAIAVALPVVGWAGSTRAAQTTIRIPAPAVGKSAFERVKLNIKAPKGMTLGAPVLRVTNLAQLGKGFGGDAIVQLPPKTATSATITVYLVLFMGNLSTSPASQIDLTISPQGSPHAADAVETTGRIQSILGWCGGLEAFNRLFEKSHTAVWAEVNGSYDLEGLVPKSDSGPEGFLDNMVSFLWGSCPGKPEPTDPGEK